MQDSSVLDAVVFRKATNSPVDDERAKREFIRAATVAVGNFRYEPSIENDHIIEMEGVTTRITFKLEL